MSCVVEKRGLGAPLMNVGVGVSVKAWSRASDGPSVAAAARAEISTAARAGIRPGVRVAFAVGACVSAITVSTSCVCRAVVSVLVCH